MVVCVFVTNNVNHQIENRCVCRRFQPRMTTSMQMVNNTSKLYEIVLNKIRCGQSQMEKPILEKMTFEEHKKITMQTI